MSAAGVPPMAGVDRGVLADRGVNTTSRDLITSRTKRAAIDAAVASSNSIGTPTNANTPRRRSMLAKKPPTPTSALAGSVFKDPNTVDPPAAAVPALSGTAESAQMVYDVVEPEGELTINSHFGADASEDDPTSHIVAPFTETAV